MMTQPGRWTHEEIAQEVGVSRTMLWKWRQRKDFQREYNKELRRVLRKVGRENATTTYAKEALKGDAKAARTLLEAADMI